jgi:hypothetical protein
MRTVTMLWSFFHAWMVNVIKPSVPVPEIWTRR